MWKQPSVFLSHSSLDKPLARTIADGLQEAGVRVWFDERDLLVGSSIPGGIAKGLANSDFVAVLLTPRSVESGWVEKEWHAKIAVEAQQRRIAVLPLLGERCDIPELLREKAYADFTDDFDTAMSLLVRAVRGHSLPTPTTVGHTERDPRASQRVTLPAGQKKRKLVPALIETARGLVASPRTAFSQGVGGVERACEQLHALKRAAATQNAAQLRLHSVARERLKKIEEWQDKARLGHRNQREDLARSAIVRLLGEAGVFRNLVAEWQPVAKEARAAEARVNRAAEEYERLGAAQVRAEAVLSRHAHAMKAGRLRFAARMQERSRTTEAIRAILDHRQMDALTATPSERFMEDGMASPRGSFATKGPLLDPLDRTLPTVDELYSRVVAEGLSGSTS